MTRGGTTLRRLRIPASFAAVVTSIVVLVMASSQTTAGGGGRRLVTDVVHSATTSPAGVPIDPGDFTAGACVAFAPTSANRDETVFLDAGHGGVDPGGVGVTQAGQPIYESDVNLPIELDTMALLRSDGYRVVVSRTQDSSVVRLSPEDMSDGVLSIQGAYDDVVARDVCANLAKATVLIGIYMDSGTSPDNAGSVTLYDADRPFSSANVALATLLENDVTSAMNTQGWDIPDDGVLPDAGFGSLVGDPADGGLAAQSAAYDHLLLIGPAAAGYFSSPSTMPGAVIEPLYLTDPFEGSLAASPTNQEVIAQGIAQGVEQFLGELWSTSTSLTLAPPA